MKDWFLHFAFHAIWRRKKAFYYAVSVASIAGNLVLLLGPSLRTSILSHSHALPLVSTIGLLQALQTAPRAYITSLETVSFISVLQARAQNALPQVAELVLQRSVLCVVLNLIVVCIVVKSGVLACRTSMAATSLKQEDFHLVSSFQSLRGWDSWLAPSYLHTVFTTVSDHASSNQSMLLQHVHGTHVRGSLVDADAKAPRPMQVQRHPNMLYLHDDQGLQVVPSLAAAPKPPSPAPALPSLFTIEPLDELVQSMKSHQAQKIVDMQVSRHPLRKVETKADLLQAVRPRRRAETRQIKVEKMHEHEAGRVVNEVKGKHGIRKKEQHVQQLTTDSKDEMGLVHGVEDKHDIRRTEHCVQSAMHSEGKYGGELEGEKYGDNKDSELSRKEFNERVDTFISKFKRNLTMQRKDSFNRLLELYQRLS